MKILILTKLIYKFGAISVKKKKQLYYGVRKFDNKVHMEKQTCKNSQEITKKGKQ